MKIKNNQVREILYGLRTQWGQKIELRTYTTTIDYDAGTRARVVASSLVIRKAIVLPENVEAGTISIIGSNIMENKGVISSGTRLVIVDGRQLRGTTISIGQFAEISGIEMEVAQNPIDILNGQAYLLIFRRKV